MMSGASGLPDVELADQVGRFFGVDIWFDVSEADTQGEANYTITPAGDLTVVTDREALRQSLLRRAITNPGEWETVPNYGCGLRQYLKAKNTASNRTEIEQRVRSQFLRDPRVLRVDLVTVSPLPDGKPGIVLSSIVIPRGRLRGDQPLPVQLEVR